MKQKLDKLKYLQVVLAVTAFILIFLSDHAVLAAGDFDVSIAVYKNGRYVEPFDRKIRIIEQPMPFHVVITNVSSHSVRISKKTMAGKDNAVTLEMTNDKGYKKIIKKKKEYLSSDIVIFKHMSPGESKVIKMLIDPNKWEGVPILEEGKAERFIVRAIYDNDNRKIFSEKYEVMFGEK